MYIVFLNQYYPPDAAPTGVMLEAVAEELVRQGHRVTVLCAAGGYAGREKLNVGKLKAETGGSEGGFHSGSSSQPSTRHSQPSPNIIRLRATRFGRGTFVGKLMDYASYYGGVAWRLLTLHPRPDRVVALTTPPYLSVLARPISKFRGADHAHWVMDLYPDVMAAHGMLSERALGYRLLAWLARWGFGGRRCAAVLTLGPDMAQKVASLQCSVFREEGGGKRTSNVERPTSNVEEGKDVCSCASMTAAGFLGEGEGTSASSICPLTLNPQLSTSSIEWVPLWGEGGSEKLKFEKLNRGERDGQELSATCPDRGPPGGGIKAEIEPLSSPDSQLSTSAQTLRRTRGWRDDELIVMYSGNMGLGHRFGEILEVVRRLNIEHRTSDVEHRTSDIEHRTSDVEHRTSNIEHRTSDIGHRTSDIGHRTSDVGHRSDEASSGASATVTGAGAPLTRFVFFGGGRRRGEIEAFLRDNPGYPVELHDYAPAEDLAAHLQSADVHLVSLDAVWTGTMVPSKLQGIFAAGRPVIFVGRAESSIGRWILESGGGWVVAPDDVLGLSGALSEARDPQVRETMGRAAKRFSDRYFDKATNAARVAAILSRDRGVDMTA